MPMLVRAFRCSLTALAGMAAVANASAQAPAKAAPPAAIPADWDQRDSEARWVAMQRALAAAPATRPSWIAELGARREFELLEWLVVYDYDATSGGATAIQVLRQADAPQWIRCAHWQLRHPDSHRMGAARQLFSGPETLAWLHAHVVARQLPKAKQIYDQFRAQVDETLDVSRYLPPLEPGVALAVYLDAPRELPELGSARSANPSVRYLHQVTRAIRGVRSLADPEPLLRHKLLRLTRHADARVRIEAYRAFSGLKAHYIPASPLLEDANSDAPVRVRRWALMAASFSGAPAAYFELLSYARSAEVALREVALSRLGDLGDGFAAERLRAIVSVLPEKSVGSGLPTATKIERRWRKLQPKTWSGWLPLLFRRAVYRGFGNGAEDPYVSWLKGEFARLRAADAAYGPVFADGVRQFAAGLEDGSQRVGGIDGTGAQHAAWLREQFAR